MPDKAAIIKEAQKYLAKGQIEKAIAEWEKLLSENPDANVFNTMGDLYLRKGDKRSAVDNFHRAANYFRAEGFSLKALALYKKIINIDPVNADSLAALGELSEEKGLITDAIKYYLSAADILAKDSQKERFLGIYEKILSLAPANIPLRDKVAGLFLKEGLVSHAVREYLYIARLCLDRGDLDQAGDYFSKMLDIEPDNRDALIGQSRLSEQIGDIPQAIVSAQKALDKNPQDVELLQRCASLLTEAGAYDDAISCLSRIVELHPFDSETHRLIGSLYRTMGDKEKAWESYRKVVDSLVSEGGIRDAIGIVQEFKELDPVGMGKLLLSLYKQDNDMDAAFEECLFIADLLSDSGLQNEGVQYYREALRIRPDDVPVKRKIAEQEIKLGVESSERAGEKTAEDILGDADIFFKYGLYDEAQSLLEGLKVQEPGNIDVHTRLRSVYLEIHDKEQAVTECLILAELYGRSGDNEKREGALREALEINPDDPRLVERAPAMVQETAVAPPAEGEIVSPNFDDHSEDVAEAEFYLRQGLSQEALRIYQKLVKLFPDHEELQKKVSALQGGIQEPEEKKEEVLEESEEDFQFGEFTLSETETVETHEAPEPHFDSDVLDIFEEFKKGLEKELEAEDYETHYNLGIAYKEMGLIDDAIKEFQTSRKDVKYYVHSMSMLGICYMEKGLFPLAIDAFTNAVKGIETRDESYWGAKFDLATAHEKNGNLKEAFEIFREIYGWDSKFREVTEKLNELRIMIGKIEPVPPAKEKKNRVSYL